MLHALLIALDHPRLTATAGAVLVVGLLTYGLWPDHDDTDGVDQ